MQACLNIYGYFLLLSIPITSFPFLFLIYSLFSLIKTAFSSWAWAHLGHPCMGMGLGFFSGWPESWPSIGLGFWVFSSTLWFGPPTRAVVRARARSCILVLDEEPPGSMRSIYFLISLRVSVCPDTGWLFLESWTPFGVWSPKVGALELSECIDRFVCTFWYSWFNFHVSCRTCTNYLQPSS
jgi:hypothetical protein